MTNLKNYNFTGLDYLLSNSEYWDFYLNTDGTSFIGSSNIGDWDSQDYNNNDWNVGTNAEESLIVGFKFKYIYSNPVSQIISYKNWEDATTSSFTASTYGLTGLDNGAIPYDPSTDNFGHTALLSALTGTTLVHISGNTTLTLKQVTGYTGNYVYPTELIITTASTGNYINFCGGFYQGYYKLDGYDYQVLPNRYQKGWTIDSWLYKSDTICSGTTGTTLNDTYPDNKGFFYYIGTRAENKFWNIFTGNTASGCTSGSTDFCMDVKETDVNINNIIVDGSGTTLSVPLSPPPIDIEQITNQFLIFGRSNGVLCNGGSSKDGYGQTQADNNYVKGTTFYSYIVREETIDFTNPFLIFGRSNGVLCNGGSSEDGYGQTQADNNFLGLTSPITELDKEKDLLDNAIGFRIKDDGSIGYRLLTVSADCKSIEVVEEYSASGMVTPDKWEHITIKWINNDTFNECDLINGAPRKGKLKFYVNSMLIFVSQELDEMIFKRLDDLMEKQVGVPYNVSIGGGSQGLLESMTFDGQDADDLGLVIEQNFAGTFIGSISTFNFYDKPLSWCEIKNVYKNNLTLYT